MSPGGDTFLPAAESLASIGTGMGRAGRCEVIAVFADDPNALSLPPLGTYRFALHMHTGRSGHSFLLRNS